EAEVATRLAIRLDGALVVEETAGDVVGASRSPALHIHVVALIESVLNQTVGVERLLAIAGAIGRAGEVREDLRRQIGAEPIEASSHVERPPRPTVGFSFLGE